MKHRCFSFRTIPFAALIALFTKNRRSPHYGQEKVIKGYFRRQGKYFILEDDSDSRRWHGRWKSKGDRLKDK